MLPKIQSTVELREKQIADDLEHAQAARSEAEETEAAWRARMDVAGAHAARIAQEAQQDSPAKTQTNGPPPGGQAHAQGERPQSRSPGPGAGAPTRVGKG